MNFGEYEDTVYLDLKGAMPGKGDNLITLFIEVSMKSKRKGRNIATLNIMLRRFIA